jgi:hypothetical protein
MNFYTGKIYNMPSNFYFYKANQPRIWGEYCKKVEPNSSCIIFPENDEISKSESDDDSWVDMKKFL